MAFVGDILDIKLPTDPRSEGKAHRGFAFLTFSNPEDAADAIDNYDLNELPGFKGQGKFLKCSVANPDKFKGDGKSGRGDRPSEYLVRVYLYTRPSFRDKFGRRLHLCLDWADAVEQSGRRRSGCRNTGTRTRRTARPAA